MPDNRTVVDLFSGAGGLSLGFSEAGFRVLASFDNFEAAIASYRGNIGDHARLSTVDEDTELPQSDIIAGGPPCQGFSSAGLRRDNDARNSLVSVFANLIAKHRPLCFVFENVEGFLTAANGERVIDLLRPLVAAGYRIHLRKINAANYGVPQLRKRVIGIGGLGWTPTFPEPTHRAHGAPGAHLEGHNLPLCPSIGDAILDLPPASFNPPGYPAEHYTKQLTGDLLKRAHALRPGQTMRDLPKELWHDSYKRRAYRRVKDGTPTERRGGAPAGLRRLISEEPSKTITSGAPGEFLHPVEDRFLTLSECARIQTFPDTFVFEGSQSEKALQIGNAVPPRLAKRIANSIAKEIPNKPGKEKGKLLSFVPTLANGMSPALQRTADLVARLFSDLDRKDQLTLCL